MKGGVEETNNEFYKKIAKEFFKSIEESTGIEESAKNISKKYQNKIDRIDKKIQQFSEENIKFGDNLYNVHSINTIYQKNFIQARFLRNFFNFLQPNSSEEKNSSKEKTPKTIKL